MTSDEFHRLVAEAGARYEALPPEQQAAMWQAQREGYAKAEASWPKPNFKRVNGVKVYDSYEDYCND